jgi:hypothetical protein
MSKKIGSLLLRIRPLFNTCLSITRRSKLAMQAAITLVRSLAWSDG